jgi:hypothetical protein
MEASLLMFVRVCKVFPTLKTGHGFNANSVADGHGLTKKKLMNTRGSGPFPEDP